MLQTLGTALLAAALAQAPTGKKGEASDEVMSHVYAGLTSVRPIYLGGSDCRPPAGFQVLQPHKLASGAWDTQDPVYRVTDGMVMRISDWTRLLWANQDPFWNDGVCVGVFNDVDAKGRPAPNAFATDARHVLLGARLNDRIVRKGSDFESALIYVTAHEFGHHLQYRAKLTFDGPTSKERELQADCLAGYLMAFSTRRLPGPQGGFYNRAYQLAQELGDDDVDAPDHHGTAAERKTALMMGFAKAISDLMNASERLGKKGDDWKPGSKDMLQACGRSYPAVEQRPAR